MSQIWAPIVFEIKDKGIIISEGGHNYFLIRDIKTYEIKKKIFHPYGSLISAVQDPKLGVCFFSFTCLRLVGFDYNKLKWTREYKTKSDIYSIILVKSK